MPTKAYRTTQLRKGSAITCCLYYEYIPASYYLTDLYYLPPTTDGRRRHHHRHRCCRRRAFRPSPPPRLHRLHRPGAHWATQAPSIQGLPPKAPPTPPPLGRCKKVSRYVLDISIHIASLTGYVNPSLPLSPPSPPPPLAPVSASASPHPSHSALPGGQQPSMSRAQGFDRRRRADTPYSCAVRRPAPHRRCKQKS